MNPVGALVAAVIILDETITFGVWVGLVFIVGGILATNWRLQDRTQDAADDD
jgi:drug/metabolite transporter (DMT)-like permease